MTLSSAPSRVRRAYERVAARIEGAVSMLERRYTPLGRFSPGPFQGWRFLWRPAVLGFVAMCAILGGACFTNSPFKLEIAHTWFFGVPTQSGTPTTATNETTLMFSIVLVFGGLVLLMRVWLRLAEVVRLHAGAPLKSLWGILGLWSLPMIVAPPMFSRDIFSYAAQGEMAAHNISPYIYGPYTFGAGPSVTPVDPLWWNTPAPYGPLFFIFDKLIVRVSGYHELTILVGLRLLEVAAVALLAAALPMLASAVGRDRGEAFVLGALNPLVLLTLIGGAHNDALMAALLVTGIAFAARRRPLLGVLLCSCAAAIKAPAALGIVYIAWTWLGPNIPWRRKLRPFLVAGAVSAATLASLTLFLGLGLGWVRNLATPGTVRSWAAPATGLGLGIADLARAVGWHLSTSGAISVTRVVGLAAALGWGVWLLLNADRRGWIRSLAVSLLLFVILGPVVQPWYLVWGLVLLAAVYEGREHFWLLGLSIAGPFLGLPGGRQLLDGLIHANFFAMLAAMAILGGMLLVPMGTWTQWSWPQVTQEQSVGAAP
jgi:hypothetical protein